MLLLINGSYLFRELAYRARKQQQIVYETSMHIGCIQPINHYVLIFDTIIRIHLIWKQLLLEINKRYDVTKIVVIKSKLPLLYLKHTPKIKLMEEVQTIIDEFNRCGNRFPFKVQYMFNSIAEYFGTYTDTQWGKCTMDDRNKLIKRILRIYSIDQTYLKQEEYEFIYNIFCSRFTVCEDALFYNVLYLSNKPSTNNEVFDINFKQLSTIKKRYRSTLKCRYIEVTEDRTIVEISRPLYPYLLYFSDDNFIPILKNIEDTYIKIKRSDSMDGVTLPRSTRRSKYYDFKPHFLNVCSELKIDISKNI